MKSRDTLIRLHKFHVDERRRQVAELEMMLDEFRRKESDLERQVKSEQEKAGISDIGHFAYPMFAKSVIKRRENILRSIDDLTVQLEAARDQLAEAYRELKKVETLEENRKRRTRKIVNRREQAELDEVALTQHRRAETSRP